MPTIPSSTKCSELGCKNQRSKLNTKCIEHGGKNSYNDTESRYKTNKMYWTAQWERIRVAQLSRQPLCQSCLLKGKVTQAIHVDHLFPWVKLTKEAFYHNVFQSLCHECHSTKTALENKGIIRYYSEFKQIDYDLSEYGKVMQS